MESSSTSDDIFAHVPRKQKKEAQHEVIPTGEGDGEATKDDSYTVPVELSIPRKKKAKVVENKAGNGNQASTMNDGTLDFPQNHPNIEFVSATPLILRIKVPRGRNSSTSKRHRSYKEVQDSDSDDIMTEEEEQMLIRRRKQKRRKDENSASTADIEAAVSPVVVSVEHPPLAVETPPPGTLSTLWYSREVFLNIFSVEKIYGWKNRPKIELIVKAEAGHDKPVSTSNANISSQPPDIQQDEVSGVASGDSLSSSKLSSLSIPVDVDGRAKLDVKEAERLQGKILGAYEVWTEEKKRMEVSRINPRGCPVIAQLAAAEKPQLFEIRQQGFEEVILVKWRGRSHLHCSWERASDVQRLDPSTSSSAKAKVKRFYQSQESSLGRNWKAILSEQRNQNEKSKHGGVDMEDLEHNGEEYYSPQYIEIERILSCDESSMEMGLYAKQRALNLVDDKVEAAKSELPFREIATRDVGEWDPEDNVRYVVKWKGLPFAEVTWEYWRDIKYDAVDEAEDFWLRQRAPNVNEAEKIAKRGRPHMKLFKQIRESREYGVSTIPRPIADLVKGGVSEDSSEEAGAGFRLRSYQLEGVNWLLFNWWNRRSCILADEMGLGKTIQSAAFLQELQLQPAVQISGPFLIVAPLSLVTQWQSELKSWAPDMNTILFHGSAEARDFLVETEFYYNFPFVAKSAAATLKKLQITKFNVLITTYEVLLKDITLFSRIEWKALILDEAHRIKNHRSKLFEELSAVPREHCILLTGTPIANATEELWALLHFANPKQFNDRESFLQKFGEMTGANQVGELHNLLKPYLLRRVKEDVEKSLPNKEETILEITLTPIQKKFYKAIYERNTSFLFKGAKAANTPSLMNVMMELRKCCNHPFLIQGAEELILKEAATKTTGVDSQNSTNSVVSNALYFDQLVKSSGKMVLLDKLLQKLFDAGHKVLIFSQMVRVLDLLEEFLKLRGYKFERLDGSTSASSRLHAVDRFKRKACQRFVMLLSTRAGGLGLNLTTADIVVIFDSDWNPQNDLQAMARAHRIGQTKAVKVYRLLTAKTYEMHMFHSASLKLGLERAVLSQNRESADGTESLAKTTKKESREAQAKEIDQLLKKGAYDVFREEDDEEAAEKFMESDIDQLLEHSSKKVTYGKSATSSIGSGLGSFSKASFVASTESGEKDVDLDDPDFWSKAVGLDTPQEIPEELNAMLDDGVKRVRKQVQQYDPYADIAKSEQLKKDRIAAEKEEKERMKEEKKKKKLAEIEEKRRIKEEKAMAKRDKDSKPLTGSSSNLGAMAAMVPKLAKKTKKSTDRSRAVRRASYADPVIERMKQAWEIPQRNRVTAAIVRFGFGRFTKIRSEANLSSIPLQDIEVFARSYIYQITLQVAVLILNIMQDGRGDVDLNGLLLCWTGDRSLAETHWLSEAISGALSFQRKVERDILPLRMPWILTEPTYVEELRHGAGLRALRRVFVASRVNIVVEECLDEILQRLGQEELGKRGCGPKAIKTLDADLKSRFVTTEELMLSVSKRLCLLNDKAPSTWWDRSCDIGLVVGSFMHGLGSYEAMKSDPTMPFRSKITNASAGDKLSLDACRTFDRIVTATRRVFDDALESNRIKAELEVQRTIAEAAKAASEREEAAALVRKGGVEAEVVAKRMPDTQVINAFEFDGSDSHFVTLPRLHERVIESLVDNHDMEDSTNETWEQQDQSPKPSPEDCSLPMPDARTLDFRLSQLLNGIDKARPKAQQTDSLSWEKSSIVEENIKTRAYFMQLFHDDWAAILHEHDSIGWGGNQCGISHRALNDGTDYGFGSAGVVLSQLAYGTDAPRYLRALGVPMNITRAALIALSYSRVEWVDNMLDQEKLRFFGKGTNTSLTTNQNTESPEKVSIRTTDMISQEDQHEPQPSVCGQTEANHGVPQAVDPASLIELSFRGDSRLRAHVCMAVLFLGYPRNTPRRPNPLLSKYAGDSCGSSQLFDVCAFRSALVDLSPDMTIPRKEALHEYIEHFLLPHCVRLCVSGNGPSTRNARGSQGDFETAFGINIHPEPSQNYPSPIPDPCLSPQEHSHEAVNVASSILRRVRLVRSCISLCSVESENDIPNIEEAATTFESIHRSHDMPIWWQPGIHDVTLLLEAASHGLFSVCKERPAEFSMSKLRQETMKILQVTSPDAPSEQLDVWADQAAKSFPSLYQLERRLGAFCSVLTKTFDKGERFPYLPMFDHGGWPRK